MKILWLNPWFGNYRVPVYGYLKQYTDDNFYLIYGTYTLSQSLRDKLTDVLGDKAIPIDNSKQLVIGDLKSNMANSAVVIPYFRGVYRAVRKIRPDVIIVDGFFRFAPLAMLYSLLNHVPLIIDYERTKHVERNSPKWRTLYRRLAGKIAKGFVVNGSLTIDYLKTLGLGKKVIVPGAMAADSQGLKAAVSAVTDNQKEILRDKLKLKSGLTYLFVGQLVERKGVVGLLTAWKAHQSHYPNDNLLILGDGILYESMANIIDGEGLNAHLTGQVPYDEIGVFYAAADVMVMPTLEDNWSLVVPEAMACGLPILCSIYNGCYPELIKEGENGFTFDPSDEESFINALGKIHGCNLPEMGIKSIEIESKFTPDIAAANILRCCNDVLSEK